uniref:galanin receptor type 1b n=1 Tax=Doryrhamphus excisus TaxID=161450 RepID=UPI0025AE8042|nr:galanin receptor type 1b [Doryrhamphus excisus]
MLQPGNDTRGWAEASASNRSGSPDDGPGPEAVVVPVLFGLIFTAGLVGNTLVLLVTCRVSRAGAGSGGSPPGNPTNIFISNLSVADLLFLLLCVPFHATIYSLPNWVFGGFVCRFGHFFASVSVLVSVFTLVAMSVDRYVAVVRSDPSRGIRTRRNALVGVGVIWTVSLVVSVPVAQHQVLIEHPSAPNSTFCWERWSGRARHTYKVSMVLVGFVVPLLLISCCYVRVLCHLHKKMKNMSKRSEHAKQKTTQTVLLVITAFAICWIPHHVITMWAEFGTFPLTDASFAFRIVSHCLSYAHSCVNPVLYAFLSERFRKACGQVFTLPLWGPAPSRGSGPRSRTDNPSSTHSTTNI